MPADREIVVHDRRRPAWEWSAELSDPEREELAALRSERADLLARVDELHVAAQEAHDREQTLRALVHRLAAGPWWSRLATARRVRRRNASRQPVD